MKLSTSTQLVAALALLLPSDAERTKSILSSGEPLEHNLKLAMKFAPVARLETPAGKSGEPGESEFPEEGDDTPAEEDDDVPEVALEDDGMAPEPEEGGVPANDSCESAISIGPGDVLTGSNVMATSETVPPCGSFLGGEVEGVWYTIDATGGGLGGYVDADYDMQAAIYLGECGNFVCIDGTTGTAFPWQKGEFKGASILGETYYVIVAGWQGASGSFELGVTEGEIPANSECVDAEPIELGVDVRGTTEYASTPNEGEFPPCTIDEVLFGITSPTVFYKFEGTGSIVQFSVYSNWDSQISIYEGDDCESLTCWNSNDDAPIEGPSSVIAQPLDEGKTYYISVHGYERNYGEFTLKSEELEPAENDNCVDAIALENGETVYSDTLAATGDPDLPYCGLGSNASSPGVWYTITGTGNTMQVRLDNTTDPHFSIYTGACDALECLDSSFFGFYPYTWDSEEGTDYFIFVYGRTHALTDTFGIIAEEVERPANDDCDAGITLELNEVVQGTTRASTTEDDLEFCGDVLGIESLFGGVWYQFEGTGETLLVGVSAGAKGEGFFDTVVSVYSGSSCDELTCLDGNDQGLSFGDFENVVVVDTVEGETYHAFVHGYGMSRGDFEIGLAVVPLPENDDCATAEILEMGDSIAASTEFAHQTDDFSFESCGTSRGGNFTAPGVWYQVTGGGFPVQASVFGQYDIQLTVFSGVCDALECVDGTEGNEGDFFNGRVIFDAADGEEYYILVHGYSGQTGEFELFYETAITRQ